jgi:uncharacterized small protein (DUF1192 family)
MMMDEPEAPRAFRGWALNEAAHEDLDLYSVGDLEARIEQLHGEIARTRTAMDKKRSSRTAAESFFSLAPDRFKEA